MGSGKTSGMINYMNDHKEKRWLFITKYIDEAERVGKACNFTSPSKHFTGRKIDNLESLINDGENISSTHALFALMSKELLEKVEEMNYSLVIDETIQLVDKLDYSPWDVDQLIKYHVVDIDPSSKKVIQNNSKYREGYFSEAKQMSDVGCLYAVKGEFSKQELYTRLHISFFESFEDVYLMTYLYDYQPISVYFKSNNLNYFRLYPHCNEGKQYIDDVSDEKKYDLKINLLQDVKINNVGYNQYDLSVSWYKGRGDKEQLKNNIYNVFHNIWHVKPSDSIWTCYKEFFDDVKSSQYKRSFVSMNLCATNEYRDRHNVVYCVNRFFPPAMRSLYKDVDAWLGEQEFALSEMVQFVWRSAVRDGEEINLYVPSKRMRDLFVGWFNTVSNCPIQQEESIIYAAERNND